MLEIILAVVVVGTPFLLDAADGVFGRVYRALGGDEEDLRATIERFRADEIEHKETALLHEAEKAPAYPLLNHAIKAGSRLAIWLSTRI